MIEKKNKNEITATMITNKDKELQNIGILFDNSNNNNNIDESLENKEWHVKCRSTIYRCLKKNEMFEFFQTAKWKSINLDKFNDNTNKNKNKNENENLNASANDNSGFFQTDYALLLMPNVSNYYQPLYLALN